MPRVFQAHRPGLGPSDPAKLDIDRFRVAPANKDMLMVSSMHAPTSCPKGVAGWVLKLRTQRSLPSWQNPLISLCDFDHPSAHCFAGGVMLCWSRPFCPLFFTYSKPNHPYIYGHSAAQSPIWKSGISRKITKIRRLKQLSLPTSSILEIDTIILNKFIVTGKFNCHFRR